MVTPNCRLFAAEIALWPPIDTPHIDSTLYFTNGCRIFYIPMVDASESRGNQLEFARIEEPSLRRGHCPMPVLTSFVAACHVAEGLPGSMSRRMVPGRVLGDRLRGLAGRKQARSSHDHETICGAITR